VEAAGDGNVAQFPAPQVGDGLGEHLRTAALDADLHNALRFGGHLNHPAPFGHGERKRLFDIDVLAGAAGVDHHEGVPVVGRGDGHGVDVTVLEQLPVVLVARRGGAGFAGRQVEVVVAEVADGRGDRIAELEKAIVHLVAAVAEADKAHAQAVVGAEDAGVAESSEGEGLAAIHERLRIVTRLQSETARLKACELPFYC
jgi:hypothetical protein